MIFRRRRRARTQNFTVLDVQLFMPQWIAAYPGLLAHLQKRIPESGLSRSQVDQHMRDYAHGWDDALRWAEERK